MASKWIIGHRNYSNICNEHARQCGRNRGWRNYDTIHDDIPSHTHHRMYSTRKFFCSYISYHSIHRELQIDASIQTFKENYRL